MPTNARGGATAGVESSTIAEPLADRLWPPEELSQETENGKRKTENRIQESGEKSGAIEIVKARLSRGGNPNHAADSR